MTHFSDLTARADELFAERQDALRNEVAQIQGGQDPLRQRADQLYEERKAEEKEQREQAILKLFESAARAAGRRVIACVLTGMGSDGAKGMAALKAADAYTMCQDEESSVVFGMPRSALALGAVHEILDPESMGKRLRQLIRGQSGVHRPSSYAGP